VNSPASAFAAQHSRAIIILARATTSDTRSGSSISTAHLAIPPNTCL